jgi:hypothetical protein
MYMSLGCRGRTPTPPFVSAYPKMVAVYFKHNFGRWDFLRAQSMCNVIPTWYGTPELISDGCRHAVTRGAKLGVVLVASSPRIEQERRHRYKNDLAP